MNAEIKSVGAYVPPNRVTNDDLAQRMETSDEWIRSHTGIGARHIADKEQSSSDLAYESAQIAIQRAGIQAKDIDMILTATATPDYYGFPSTSCILQDRLGAVNSGALDVAAACTGFVYSLGVAKGLIVSGTARTILVSGVEILTKYVNWDDRNTCVLFGDGAGSVIVQANENDNSGDIIYSKLMAEGSGSEHLAIPYGGSRNPFDPKHPEKFSPYMTMNGRPVYNFATRVNNWTLEHILEVNNLGIDDISYIVPHQANIRIIQAAAKRLNIPIEKFYINIQEYANTSAATIPIALNEMHEKGLLKKGDLLITLGFGGGLTYGGNLLRW
ncbi:MAG: ketoacyl-ACP synthase III [Spirochaetales bacterium]|nr:ketoacyl-ACP synthase III [Spirochaetales bacterium]